MKSTLHIATQRAQARKISCIQESAARHAAAVHDSLSRIGEVSQYKTDWIGSAIALQETSAELYAMCRYQLGIET